VEVAANLADRRLAEFTPEDIAKLLREEGFKSLVSAEPRSP